MPPKYLNVKEAAAVVGVSEDEIKQMLERRELHGYRDGADWKFKVDDVQRVAAQQAASASSSTVDRLGAEEIERIAKDRTPQGSAPADDEGDVLLSEVELGRADTGASGTVIGMESIGKASAESDIRLADSDVHPAPSRPAPAPAGKEKAAADSKTGHVEELDLTLDQDLTLEDSNVATAAVRNAPGDSAVDLSGKKLEDDDLVLGGSGTGSDISIGGDSGISLVDPADSGLSLEEPLNLGTSGDESLELGEDDMLALSGAQSSPSMKTDDDFQLTPMPDTEADESESGSQVIALDTEGEGDEGVTMIAGGGGMAAMLDEDLSSGTSPGFGMPAGDVGMAGQPAGLMSGAPVMQPSFALPEAPYSVVNIVFLVLCTLLLVVAGIMIVDLVAHQSGYDSTHFVGSPFLDSILSLFEK